MPCRDCAARFKPSLTASDILLGDEAVILVPRATVMVASLLYFRGVSAMPEYKDYSDP